LERQHCFSGVDKQVNDPLGDKLKPAATKARKDYAKNVAEGMRSGESDLKNAADKANKANAQSASKSGANALGIAELRWDDDAILLASTAAVDRDHWCSRRR
jgi:hypothetical protein